MNDVTRPRVLIPDISTVRHVVGPSYSENSHLRNLLQYGRVFKQPPMLVVVLSVDEWDDASLYLGPCAELFHHPLDMRVYANGGAKVRCYITLLQNDEIYAGLLQAECGGQADQTATGDDDLERAIAGFSHGWGNLPFSLSCLLF
jgi:hypothetical protein